MSLKGDLLNKLNAQSPTLSIQGAGGERWWLSKHLGLENQGLRLVEVLVAETAGIISRVNVGFNVDCVQNICNVTNKY